MSDSDFDWNNDPDVVIASQLAVAVFKNAAGDVVVRQEAPYYSDEDAAIIIRPENARTLAEAILALVAPLALPAPTRTGTERQRRHREPELFEVRPPD